jgi:hypothetical protein
MAQLSRIGGF